MTWLQFLLLHDDAFVLAEFWRESLARVSGLLLPLSSLLDCSSSEEEFLESWISRGKYEKLKARDIFMDKMDFSCSFRIRIFFSRRSRASALLLSLSCIRASLISSSNRSSSFILRQNASRLLFSMYFSSCLFLSSISS